MKVLIIGSGGREHALAWKVAQDPRVEKIFVAPGNAGTATEAKCENVTIDVCALEQLADFAEKNVDLTIVGPEAPLVIGVVDLFRSRGLDCFGPTQGAAQLEGSKAFTKDFLARHKIPTADYQNFTEIEPALAYLREKGAPIVIKADGLAAGKGVIVAMTLQEAEDAVRDMLAGNAFGDAGSRVVIEEFLDGEEASFIVMVDGHNVLPMATSQDHKRVGDQDSGPNTGGSGPNTGGMGAYSPAPVVTAEVHQRVMDQVIWPTVRGMAAEGNVYTGFLYAGLDRKSVSLRRPDDRQGGQPQGHRIQLPLRRPGNPTGDAAPGVEPGAADRSGLRQGPGQGRGAVGSTSEPGRGAGGRWLPGRLRQGRGDQRPGRGRRAGRQGVPSALGDTVQAAQQQAYRLAEQISWDASFYRTDIGYRAIARERGEYPR